MRNQPEYPRVVAGLAWIDTARTTLALNPGRLEPSVEIPRGAMDVPRTQRGKLLATFNSGFKLSDSKGGFVLHGHTYAAMRNGQGTLVGFKRRARRRGRLDLRRHRAGLGVLRAPEPAADRQRRRPNPTLSNGGEWGATVGNAVLVWRSGIGIDGHGNLIYAAGNDQTVASLARTLIHAGAVRAMELDINSYWVSFISYGAPGAEDPSNLLPDMERRGHSLPRTGRS